jgi:hypothetical protein
MNELIARRRISNGEEIIELDLNKPWPRDSGKYANYMDEVDRIAEDKRQRKCARAFIEVIN